MKKTKRAWGILNGKILLPFSIRASRRLAIEHGLERAAMLGMLGNGTTPQQYHEAVPYERVVAVDITWED